MFLRAQLYLECDLSCKTWEMNWDLLSISIRFCMSWFSLLGSILLTSSQHRLRFPYNNHVMSSFFADLLLSPNIIQLSWMASGASDVTRPDQTRPNECIHRSTQHKHSHHSFLYLHLVIIISSPKTTWRNSTPSALFLHHSLSQTDISIPLKKWV